MKWICYQFSFELLCNSVFFYLKIAANQTMELFHVNNEYPTSVSMSYHCNKIETIGFSNTTNGKEYVVNATISHVQLEAFHSQQTDQFSTARDCEAIDTPDIVPIAVGKEHRTLSFHLRGPRRGRRK